MLRRLKKICAIKNLIFSKPTWVKVIASITLPMSNRPLCVLLKNIIAIRLSRMYVVIYSTKLIYKTKGELLHNIWKFLLGILHHLTWTLHDMTNLPLLILLPLLWYLDDFRITSNCTSSYTPIFKKVKLFNIICWTAIKDQRYLNWLSYPDIIVLCKANLRANGRGLLENLLSLAPGPYVESGWLFKLMYWIYSLFVNYGVKGRIPLPNRMNFRKNSKRPLTPPPSFLENYIAIFL